ncbi:hypothetical protein BDN70DRAFT_901495 [Pholiota conissans]|uniref:Uncharacterized protein n=1 Tax=Pholiota conissans TaxID=109636 RepID=A0A9P5YLR9_9AGAR|nr:hypothetical protein BDN70DRAFT_901495 [Pholiota conissans]
MQDAPVQPWDNHKQPAGVFKLSWNLVGVEGGLITATHIARTVPRHRAQRGQARTGLGLLPMPSTRTPPSASGSSPQHLAEPHRPLTLFYVLLLLLRYRSLSTLLLQLETPLFTPRPRPLSHLQGPCACEDGESSRSTARNVG